MLDTVIDLGLASRAASEKIRDAVGVWYDGLGGKTQRVDLPHALLAQSRSDTLCRDFPWSGLSPVLARSFFAQGFF
jgi:hypothetical protein